MERLRLRMLAEIGGSADVRDWVACLVRPVTDHLAALGSPTWYARFSAQVMTDPALREIMIEESLASPSLRQNLDGLTGCLPRCPRRCAPNAATWPPADGAHVRRAGTRARRGHPHGPVQLAATPRPG